MRAVLAALLLASAPASAQTTLGVAGTMGRMIPSGGGVSPPTFTGAVATLANDHAGDALEAPTFVYPSAGLYTTTVAILNGMAVIGGF